MRHRSQRHRQSAFAMQHGLCRYCQSPLITGNLSAFAKRNQLPLGAVKLFECTAEHVIAQQDGGSHAAINIWAVCRRCNHLRHRRKNPLTAAEFQQHVQRRLSQSRWFNAYLAKEFLLRLHRACATLPAYSRLQT